MVALNNYVQHVQHFYIHNGSSWRTALVHTSHEVRARVRVLQGGAWSRRQERIINCTCVYT